MLCAVTFPPAGCGITCTVLLVARVAAAGAARVPGIIIMSQHVVFRLCATSLVLAVGMTAVGVDAWASPEPFSDLRTTSQAIAGGQTETMLTAVVGLSRGGFSICSGSLIAPNLVLTAQHCVADTPQEYAICGGSPFDNLADPRVLFVSTETNLFDAERYIIGEEVYVPPGGNDICGYDLALIILEENIPPDQALYLVPRIDLQVLPGESYTAVGYGHTGQGRGAGTRRSLDGLTVSCVGQQDCGWFSFVQDTEWEGSPGVCQGDSGGPALDEDGQVIGVVSRGPEGCGSTTYGSVYEWADWIRDIGERAAELGGYPAPAWVTLGDSSPSLLDADEDGVRTEYDNCPDVANPDQLDDDENGVGDDCQIFPEPRGGSCTVCDGCLSDDDCVVGFCLQTGDDLGICTLDCDINAETDTCPGNTDCRVVAGALGNENAVCVNRDIDAAGLCAEAFVCDASFVEPPPVVDTTGGEGGGRSGGGCAAAPGAAPNAGGTLALLAGLGLLATRRRRAN
jgi:MYXO-CTERM domain-containing protein